MLVLTRKVNEEILIGEDIKITLVRIRGSQVRVGIEAPREMRIIRGEIDGTEKTSQGGSGDGPLDRIAKAAKSHDRGGRLHRTAKAKGPTNPPLAAFMAAS